MRLIRTPIATDAIATVRYDARTVQWPTRLTRFPRSPRLPRSPRPWQALVIAAGLLGGACDRDDSPPADSPPGDAGDVVGAVVTPARYRTGLTFVGSSPDRFLLHAALENRTTTTDLWLGYRAWVRRSGTWAAILDENNRLPTPRAAWRVVPTPALRVVVGTAGDVTSLTLLGSQPSVRLRAGTVLASWAGASGQPESLRRAILSDGDSAQAGFLLVRRGARSERSPVPNSTPHFILLTDSLGNAFLLMRGHDDPDAAATAWTVIDGIENEWPDLRFESAGSAGSTQVRWTLDMPEAGISGEITAKAPFVDDLASAGTGVRVYEVTGFLQLSGSRRRIEGLGLEERGP